MNHNGKTMPSKAPSALLALMATASAACLSLLAGWQRGGLLAERVLLICVGVVLVVAAHLLPGLCRPHGWRIRALGATLWMGCMVATCYGHTVFFVMAQQHAGEIRAAAIPVDIPTVSASGRNLTEIANDRADVVVRLARLAERRCAEKCAAVRIERTTLTARLAALDVESVEITRRGLALERADAERAVAKADPVAGLLTAFGVAASRVDLVAGMAFAVVLEGVACFCWLLVLRPPDAPPNIVNPAREDSHVPPVTPVTPVTPVSIVVTPGGNDATKPEKTNNAPAGERVDELGRVLAAIGDGALRGTVAEIRKYLGCSQSKAAALRKQLTQHPQPRPATSEAIE